jgi:hypothetical protein
MEEPGMTRAMRICAAPAVLLAAIALAAGCGGRAGAGGPGKDMGLEYKMPKGEALTYRSVSESAQNMKIQGMDMKITSDKKLVFTVTSKGTEGDNFRLGVTVDSLEANTVSMQGNITADASGILGKSFDMLLSPLGAESDLAGAAALQYDMGMAGKRSVSPEFQGFFPDLAGRPVEVGDTWTSTDTLNVDEGGSDIQIALTSVNTLEGFEKVNGLDCAKVSAAVTGTLGGTGQQGGAQLSFNGTIQGTYVWYFARKKGVLVKTDVNSTIENTVKVSGPQQMEIPITETSKSKVVLVK